MFKVLFFCLLFLWVPQIATAQYVPTGHLATVPVLSDCGRTGGDIAIAVMESLTPTIYFCPTVADQINWNIPGAGHFFFVHEFGHIAENTSDEAKADCWAARQLAASPNGETFLKAAVRHFLSRGLQFHPKYGTAQERAHRIAKCAGISAQGLSPPAEMGRSCCTPAGRCGPFYDQPALPLKSACFCSAYGTAVHGQVCL